MAKALPDPEELTYEEALEALEAIVKERQAAAARANNRRQVSDCTTICSKFVTFGAGIMMKVI